MRNMVESTLLQLFPVPEGLAQKRGYREALGFNSTFLIEGPSLSKQFTSLRRWQHSSYGWGTYRKALAC